jgi:hypothetical protein
MIPVSVTLLYLRDGAKNSTRVTLSMDVGVKDTIARLIADLNLPLEEDGERLHYNLIRQRQILDYANTLYEAGVQEGDILQLAIIDDQATMGLAIPGGLLARLGGKSGAEPLPVAASLVTEAGKVYKLQHTRALIGRADARLGYPAEALDADLSDLDPDRTVSRPHALIVYSGGEFTIRDLYSQGGLLINGVRVSVSKAEVLHNGDVLTLGHVTVRFCCDS